MKSALGLLALLLWVPTIAAEPAGRSSAEEVQFRGWLTKYLSDDRTDYDVSDLVYGYALVDLNGDGRNEAVVWARDNRTCGTGGCDLQVFVHKKSGWQLVSSTTITRPPIKVLSTRTHGWRDLAALQAGGGIVRPYDARLQYDGKQYRSVSPEDWTGRKSAPVISGRVIIADATMPLSPSKCRQKKSPRHPARCQ
jgi:hypothetical protein